MNFDFLREQPGYKEEDIDCMIHVWETIEVIGGKWKLLILWHLHAARRFNELDRLIPDISQKMLAQHLREMEADGLISRTVYAEVPPRVEYLITAYGRTLEPVFDIMYDWGVSHKARKAAGDSGKRAGGADRS